MTTTDTEASTAHGQAAPTTAAPPRTRRTPMQVRKRNGDTEPVDVNKIVRAVERWSRRPGRRRPDARSPPAPSAACTTAPPPPSSTGCRSRPPPR